MENPQIRNLVIGSQGFLGRSLTRHLKAQGESVVEFDIKRNETEDARIAHLEIDAIDRVYLLAWDVGGAKYLYKHDAQFRQLEWNLSLMLNTLPQLENTDFLFVSSQLAEETDSVYGVTKRLGEVWTHLLGGVRVRLWNIYGSYESPNERSHVVSDFAHQAVTRGEIHMLTTGEERRQFVHLDDVCSALLLAQQQKLQGLYDVTSFEWITVMDVANLIASCTGAKVFPGKVSGSTPATPLQGKIPGWAPRIDIERGIAQLVEEVRGAAKDSRVSPQRFC